MANENLDEILGTCKDGELTKGEYSNLMSQIQTNKDYLTDKEHDKLAELAGDQGYEVLTKYQCVQCIESSIFRATGVTRG